MNSYQRIFAAAKGLPTDRLPIAPYMGNFGARVAGVKLRDYYTDPVVMAEAQYKAWEIFGQDVVVAQSDGYYMAEAFGCEATFYEDATPSLKKPVLADLSQVSTLKVPDPKTDGRMPVYLEATRLLAEKLKKKVCVRATGTGPFSLAGHLMGTQEFILAIACAQADEDEEAKAQLHALMDITTKTAIEFSKAALEAGADIIQCGDSLASLNMISPKIYETYVFPYEKLFFETMNTLKDQYEFLSLLHICGNNTEVSELLKNTGADILEIDYQVDLGEYINSFKDDMCLMGYINPAGALLNGSEPDLAKEISDCLEIVGPSSKFILGSGCEVAVDTPHQNMKTLVNARNYWLNHKNI